MPQIKQESSQVSTPLTQEVHNDDTAQVLKHEEGMGRTNEAFNEAEDESSNHDRNEPRKSALHRTHRHMVDHPAIFHSVHNQTAGAPAGTIAGSSPSHHVAQAAKVATYTALALSAAALLTGYVLFSLYVANIDMLSMYPIIERRAYITATSCCLLSLLLLGATLAISYIACIAPNKQLARDEDALETRESAMRRNKLTMMEEERKLDNTRTQLRVKWETIDKCEQVVGALATAIKAQHASNDESDPALSQDNMHNNTVMSAIRDFECSIKERRSTKQHVSPDANIAHPDDHQARAANNDLAPRHRNTADGNGAVTQQGQVGSKPTKRAEEAPSTSTSTAVVVNASDSKAAARPVGIKANNNATAAVVANSTPSLNALKAAWLTTSILSIACIVFAGVLGALSKVGVDMGPTIDNNIYIIWLACVLASVTLMLASAIIVHSSRIGPIKELAEKRRALTAIEDAVTYDESNLEEKRVALSARKAALGDTDSLLKLRMETMNALSAAVSGAQDASDRAATTALAQYASHNSAPGAIKMLECETGQHGMPGQHVVRFGELQERSASSDPRTEHEDGHIASGAASTQLQRTHSCPNIAAASDTKKQEV